MGHANQPENSRMSFARGFPIKPSKSNKSRICEWDVSIVGFCIACNYVLYCCQLLNWNIAKTRKKKNSTVVYKNRWSTKAGYLVYGFNLYWHMWPHETPFTSRLKSPKATIDWVSLNELQNYHRLVAVYTNTGTHPLTCHLFLQGRSVL